MSFTFGILAYNQENTILETLESIRYQIEHYSDDKIINLIFIDDLSMDNTVAVVKKWLNYRKNLFEHIDIILNKQNMGTVHNYNLLINKIKGPFKIIAGDDLIASGNIIEKIKNLHWNELDTYVCTALFNGSIKYDEYRGLLFLNNMLNINRKNYAIKAMRRGCFLHTPSTHYSKKLFEEAGCIDYNKQFKLFEDDPSWYAMIKNISNLKINFISDVVVLYRISEKSVSNGSMYSSAFSKELLMLHKLYYKDTKGLEHLIFWFKTNKYIPKILRLDKYIDKLRRYYLKIILKNRRDYKKFKKHVEFIIKKEQKYYNEILKNVNQYIEETTCDSCNKHSKGEQ